MCSAQIKVIDSISRRNIYHVNAQSFMWFEWYDNCFEINEQMFDSWRINWNGKSFQPTNSVNNYCLFGLVLTVLRTLLLTALGGLNERSNGKCFPISGRKRKSAALNGKRFQVLLQSLSTARRSCSPFRRMRKRSNRFHSLNAWHSIHILSRGTEEKANSDCTLAPLSLSPGIEQYAFADA